MHENVNMTCLTQMRLTTEVLTVSTDLQGVSSKSLQSSADHKILFTFPALVKGQFTVENFKIRGELGLVS